MIKQMESRKAFLDAKSKEELIDYIVDQELNEFVGNYADYRDRDQTQAPSGRGAGVGKRVPYIGWYWRNVSFAQGYITIGHCGDFVGFMENNKWGYPQRRLTPDETDAVMEIIYRARSASGQGGIVADILRETETILAELWDLLQGFSMEVDGFWIIGPQGQVAFAPNEDEANTMIGHLEAAAPGLSYFKRKAAAA